MHSAQNRYLPGSLVSEGVVRLPENIYLCTLEMKSLGPARVPDDHNTDTIHNLDTLYGNYS